MRRALTAAILLAATLGVVDGWSADKARFRVDVASLENFPLVIPENQAERNYLGLKGKGTFSIPQIKARVVIVQILSMYCPICQKDAPVVNEVFDALETKSPFKGKVKMVGVAAGNTPFEAGVYRKKFDVRFPLIADDDMQFQKISKDRILTPTFIVLKVEKGKKLKLIKVHVGMIHKAQELLEVVRSHSKGG
jgi:thiol-disulfide isomerase/thioredoxin